MLQLRVLIPSMFATLALVLTLPSVSTAHHSRSNFRFDTKVEMDGVVTSHEYRNPHTFLTIETTNDAGQTEEWLLAGNSISNLRRTGWTADSFAVGDEVTVSGNPDRDPEKLVLLLDVITAPDGTVYQSGSLAPGGQRPLSEQTFSGSTDFSGVWQPDFSQRNIAAGFMPADLPVTEKGSESLANFDQLDDPALDCIGESLPMTLLPVYPVEFTRSGNELHIRYEQFDARRVVHLGMTEHPESIEPSHMGHSIGQISGNVLTIDTMYFSPDIWGLGRGVPSGLQKHVSETYTLSDDGSRLDLEYTFTDPEYLVGSVTESGSLLLNPGYEMGEWNCDIDSARRHLSIE